MADSCGTQFVWISMSSPTLLAGYAARSRPDRRRYAFASAYARFSANHFVFKSAERPGQVPGLEERAHRCGSSSVKSKFLNKAAAMNLGTGGVVDQSILVALARALASGHMGTCFFCYVLLNFS
jgi:hypothetical protein